MVKLRQVLGAWVVYSSRVMRPIVVSRAMLEAILRGSWVGSVVRD